MKLLDIDSVYDLSDEQEPEFNDFPALNDDHMKKVNQWFYGRDLGVQLNAKFNLTITRHDIQTLSWEPLAWLNDEVINFYMELISERSRDDENLPNVHAMNTFFLQRLFDSGYSGVRRWTRKVDIFAQDIIPIPVHKGIHWCMAIIHMKNKTIKYYDSMGAPNNAVLNALVDYLKNESLDKKKVALDMSGWSIENVQDIPQQENGSDCGVFSCMYAEFVSRNRPFIFSQQHMQYFRKRMIYEICSGEMLWAKLSIRVEHRIWFRVPLQSATEPLDPAHCSQTIYWIGHRTSTDFNVINVIKFTNQICLEQCEGQRRRRRKKII